LLETKIFNDLVDSQNMADQIITYAIMIAVFVIFAGVAFGLKKKRYNRDNFVEGQTGHG